MEHFNNWRRPLLNLLTAWRTFTKYQARSPIYRKGTCCPSLISAAFSLNPIWYLLCIRAILQLKPSLTILLILTANFLYINRVSLEVFQMQAMQKKQRLSVTPHQHPPTFASIPSGPAWSLSQAQKTWNLIVCSRSLCSGQVSHTCPICKDTTT